MTFVDVLTTYGVVILEFLFELYIFCVLFLRKLNREKHFVWRVVLSTLSLLAIALPVAWFYTAFGATVWGRILVYLFLFSVVTLLAKLCFSENYLTVLFCCSMAYAAQNLVYKVFLIFWTGGEMLTLFDSWGNGFVLYYRLVYYAFLAISIAVAWFVFVRRISSKLQTRKINYRMLTVALLILGVTILLCSFEDVFFSQLSVIRENRFDVPIYYALRQTGNIFSVVCCVIVLLLASKSIVENELLQEVEYLKYAIRQSEWQYQISKDTIEMINVKCHDIKYKLNAFAAQQHLSPEAVDDLQESISIYDSRIETGNKLLNVLLSEKSLFCEQNGITLSCMMDGAKLDFMEVGDLYCLFGNIIDNALDAVQKIEQNERRVINLMVKAKDNLLLIQEENYFDGKLEFADGLPITTKGDTTYHGFGTKSIKMIVNKYGGELTTYVTDDIFHLSIIFSKQQNK